MKTDGSQAGPLVGGTLLIAFGILALDSQLLRNLMNWSYIWPGALIIFGGLFFAGMFLGGRQVSGLAIPGTIIAGIGLVLLYQSLTSDWESWSYSWTLIVTFVGAGIYLAGRYSGDERQERAGAKVAKVGFVLFVVFGAFFELIFSMNHSLGFRGLLFPSLMILLGLYLIVRRLGLPGAQDAREREPMPPSEPPATQ